MRLQLIAMYPRILFNWLVPPLRPLERKLLSSVETKLGPAHAQKFEAQIRQINYAQRRLGGREVGLYVIESGRVRRDETLKIPMAGREWRLARIHLGRNGAKWVATVHLVDGYLSSIEYDNTPPADDAADVSLSVELFEPPSRLPQSSGLAPALPEWLQPYASRFGITNIDPPLAAEDRDAIVAKLEAKLPADYLDFLATCDGVQIGPLSIVGAREWYETRTEDGQYIVIGQMNGNGALAVRKPGPVTVFMDFEDGSITELGHSLQAAIQHVMPS